MKKLSAGELGVFADQLAMLLKAGVGVSEGIELMKEGLDEGAYQVILEQLEREIQSETHLGEAFAQVDAFPLYFTHMVKIGFETGKLDEVMAKLAWYYTKEDLMRTHVKRVLFYPLILLGMMSTVILVITTQVIPVFEEVLRSLGMEMTGTAVGMMALGTLVAKGAAWLLIGSLLSVVCISIFARVKGKATLVHTCLQYSRIYEKMMITRFTKATAMMLGCGIEATYAIEVASELVEHKKLKGRLRDSVEHMKKQHGSLGDFAQEAMLFDAIGNKRLAIGIRTGCIDEVLVKLAEDYEQEVEATFDKLLGRIEPISIVILSCVVGSILLAVMLPLMSIMSTIG